MNLKERGLTVGDLVILFIIIIATIFIVKNINKESQSSFYINHQEIKLLNEI